MTFDVAPLFLLPVRLKKGQLNREIRTYEYTPNYSGEDIIPNLSLREKLRVDFALALPDLDENTRPEAYFEAVLDAARNGFASWIAANINGRPLFISNNNGIDWQFVNWYFHHFTANNPFGHSSSNLGSLYKGLVKDTFKNFKHLRRTEHTHNPVDDARGNAEALLRMKQDGLKISLK